MLFPCGMLIAIGIKYMASTASEKANLKGKFTAYIIGVVLIFMCSTIAGAFANVASSTGDNSASGVIDTAIDVGNMEIIDNPTGSTTHESSSGVTHGGTGGKF